MGTTISKIKTITLPEKVVEQLRCSFCKKYLSCAPIRILSDGRSVCGRCPLSDCDAQAYREITLEVALSHVKFPCCYKDYGCSKKLLFDRSIDHEVKCVYHPFVCPSLPFNTCSWKGSVVQVREHFNTSHIGLVNSKGKFQLDITKDKENILLVVNDDATFLIKYKYKASTSILQYDVRYFSTYVFNNANFKIQLISSLNPENSINLKGDKCLPYIFDPPTFPYHFSLTLNKFVAVLSNATIIEIEIILPTINTPFLRISQEQSHALVNYKLLDALRCAECQNYLSLPIFDGPQGTVCSDCNKNYSPSKNEEFHKLIVEANYPCRWNSCKAICKGHSIRVHEFICPYRPQKCPACKVPLVVAEKGIMKMHVILGHHYYYFKRNTMYSIPWQKSSERHMVTVTKNNEVVYLQHKITLNNVHTFKLSSMKTEFSDVNAKIRLEHYHCKLNSRVFVLKNNQELLIGEESIPKCFRIDNAIKVLIDIQQ